MSVDYLTLCGFEGGPTVPGGDAAIELDDRIGQSKIVTSWKCSGTYALQHDYTVAGANTTSKRRFHGRMSTSKLHRRVKFALYITDPASGYGDILGLVRWDAAGWGLAIIYSSDPFGWYLMPYDGTTSSGYSYGPLSANTVYIVELYWCDDGANSKIELWVDGVKRIDQGPHSDFSKGISPNYLNFGHVIGKGITERQVPHIDDLWAQAGDSYDDVIPDPLPKMLAALPNGNGDLSEWFTELGGAGDYSKWDEIPNNADTDYNESQAGAGLKRQLSNLQSCADIGIGASDTINALQQSAVAKIVAGTTGQPSLVVRDGGTDYTTDVTPSGVYNDGTYDRFDAVMPNGGAPWTQARVDAFQAGMQRATGDRNVRSTLEFLTVAYNPYVPPSAQRRRATVTG